ncbi:MAG: hypothetical protein B7Y93_02385 [Micrococcales bacterium 32-70-13]|nr:MAG: hypothetical protein B7Y93_02385 [Micrococcales bacterium 32-70-13]
MVSILSVWSVQPSEPHGEHEQGDARAEGQRGAHQLGACVGEQPELPPALDEPERRGEQEHHDREHANEGRGRSPDGEPDDLVERDDAPRHDRDRGAEAVRPGRAALLKRGAALQPQHADRGSRDRVAEDEGAGLGDSVELRDEEEADSGDLRELEGAHGTAPLRANGDDGARRGRDEQHDSGRGREVDAREGTRTAAGQRERDGQHDRGAAERERHERDGDDEMRGGREQLDRASAGRGGDGGGRHGAPFDTAPCRIGRADGT